MYLENINCPKDLKKLTIEELPILAREIREFLLENLSKTGGHLGSNLGVVDLTIVLHYLFDSPNDAFIFDVGHQAYTHKILTGRKDKFSTLRQYNGISGFPKKSESIHDIEETGHSSTSISFGYGFSVAKKLNNNDGEVICIIGDGAMTGGMALEALNNISNKDTNIIIILNNNDMSIGENIGAVSKFLSKKLNEKIVQDASDKVRDIVSHFPFGDFANEIIDRGKGAIRSFLEPGIIFRNMGIKYFGPIDGHNYEELINTFTNIKSIRGPKIVHINTIKGKGYKLAEENPLKFHGVTPFNIDTGEFFNKSNDKTFSQLAGECMIEEANNNKNVVAITAAMTSGTGLTEYSKLFKYRFFDVGIAEQHSVTFAVGLSENHIIPIVFLYSTFLQRAYDQVIHDVGIMNANVKFMIDRAGLVPEDGDTHQGVFDISFLSVIPNIVIMVPVEEKDFKMMYKKSIEHIGPTFMRYNKASIKYTTNNIVPDNFEIGKAHIIREGSEYCIISYGPTLIDIVDAVDELGLDNITIINLQTIKPLDKKIILENVKKHNKTLIIEESMKKGGVGSSILELLSDNEVYKPIKIHALPDKFFEVATRNKLLELYKLDKNGIKDIITNFFN